MGLSDNERFNGVYNVVNSFVKLAAEIRERSVYLQFDDTDSKTLLSFLDDLWPSLLSRTNNSGLWIFGNDMARDHLGETSFLGAAFSSCIHDVVYDDKDSMYDYIGDYLADPRRFFGSDTDAFMMESVMSAYNLCDSYFYYANRYDDKLSEMFRNTSNLVSRIHGYCFERFSSNDKYMLAWMSAHIFEHVVLSNEKDTVSQWFRKNNIHHDVALGKADKKFIIESFRKIQKKSPDKLLSSHDRLVIILTYAGSRFHYEHQHKELFSLIEKHNAGNKKDQIKLAQIKKLCDQARKNKLLENKNRNYDNYCNLTGVLQEN